MEREFEFEAIVKLTPSQAAALQALGITVNTIAGDDNLETKRDDLAMVSPTMTDGAQDQAIEPENLDKVEIKEVPSPFVKAQISTKNQMILRNILAALSSLGVVIVFILEKLGVM